MQLNESLRPTMTNKLSLFHDLELGMDLEKMMEYNPVLSLKMFLEFEDIEKVNSKE